jgi:hypothetical protein
MTEEADLRGFVESGASILGASAGEDLVPEAFRPGVPSGTVTDCSES